MRLGGGPQVLLGRRLRERDGETWSLPKGTPIEGESIEETALREVAEETGLEVSLGESAGAIEYFFMQRGDRVHKTVHYFLMQPTGGDLAAYDHEFEEVRWVALEEAERLMSFETEREIVSRSVPAIERLLGTGE